MVYINNKKMYEGNKKQAKKYKEIALEPMELSRNAI